MQRVSWSMFRDRLVPKTSHIPRINCACPNTSQLLCDNLFSDQLSAHERGNANKEHVDRKTLYSTTHQKQEVGAIQEVIVIDDTPTPPKVASKTWQNSRKEPEIIVIE